MTRPTPTGSWADDPRLQPWALAAVPDAADPDPADPHPADPRPDTAQDPADRHSGSARPGADEAGRGSHGHGLDERHQEHSPSAPAPARPASAPNAVPGSVAAAPASADQPPPSAPPAPPRPPLLAPPAAWPSPAPWDTPPDLDPIDPGPPAAGDPFAAQLVAAASVPRPRQGLRGLLFTASRGTINVGPSPAELDRLARLGRVRRLLPGWHSITVASMKGGVGKTSVAALLGLTLAEYRGDRVAALDANPDAGTLADRLLGRPVTATVRDLVRRDDLTRFASLNDLAHYLHTAGRLQVLASEQDPAMSEAFNRDEYRRVLQVLTRFYNIVITDSGTGLMHSALAGALEATRTLVIVGAPTIDGGSRAAKTLDWLAAHGFDELVGDAVVVLSCDRVSRRISRETFVRHFASRCRAVVEIPADPHLAEGGLIELDQLRPRTRDAALTLAAEVADAFAWQFPAPAGFVQDTPAPTDPVGPAYLAGPADPSGAAAAEWQRR